jgi:hypothetical protein
MMLLIWIVVIVALKKLNWRYCGLYEIELTVINVTHSNLNWQWNWIDDIVAYMKLNWRNCDSFELELTVKLIWWYCGLYEMRLNPTKCSFVNITLTITSCFLVALWVVAPLVLCWTLNMVCKSKRKKQETDSMNSSSAFPDEVLKLVLGMVKSHKDRSFPICLVCELY